MSKISVPVWHVAVGMAVDPQKVYERFRRLLANAPMTHSELADVLDVNPSTVSRWVQGKTQPSPETMKKVASEILNRLDEIRTLAEATDEIVDEIERAVELQTKYQRSGDKRALEEWSRTTERLEKLVST